MYTTTAVVSPPVVGAPHPDGPTREKRTLADGRIVIRHTTRCTAPGCEGVLVVCTDPEGMPIAPRTPCPMCWHRAQWERLVEFGVIIPTASQAFEDELQGFRQRYPRIAERLRLAGLLAPPGPVADGRLFDPGEIRIEHALTRDADALLTRHIRGAWGEFGKHPGLIDDDRRFAPALFGVAVGNAAAIESGAGLVLSRYPRPFEPGHWIDLATGLRPGREAETIVIASVGHHPMVPVCGVSAGPFLQPRPSVQVRLKHQPPSQEVPAHDDRRSGRTVRAEQGRAA
jgi:hypothetical protein